MLRWVRAALGVALLAVLPVAARADDVADAAAAERARLALPQPAYPVTRRDPLIETVFGQAVADPFRWLEGDIRKSPDVAEWVARQNATSRSYLAQLPGRDIMAARIRALFDYERFSLPRKAGTRYFYTRNSGLQSQSALYVRDGLYGPSRQLVDPRGWSSDGTVALDAWSPSQGGRWLAYTMQTRGSDWRTIGVVDVASGKVLDDRLEWANDTTIGWVGNEGFLYSRFPTPAPGDEYRAPTFNKSVWFHRIGTSQAQDVPVYATPDHPEWGHKASVTSDGRWVVITTEVSTQPRRAIHVIDLRDRDRSGWQAREIVGDFVHDWKFVDGMGERLWFITNQGAPAYRMMQLDLSGPEPRWQQVIAERPEALEGGNIVGDRLVLSYLRDGASTAVITDLKGRPSRAITINGIGAASGFGGRPGDPETFYQYSSFNQPPAIFRLNLRNGAVAPFAVPKLSFDPSDFVVEQRTFTSRDGTRVPMYVVRSKALVISGKPGPTLLYGYGGFDISLTPAFSSVRMAWLRSGGVFALANIRGGGEFGPAWHDAGRLDRKQNSFDDFVAAAEYLVSEGITARGGLAVQGGSNGGLLVGAVINQRPDLFAAANPDVGVMDMLRFDRFTAGRYWVDDYGSPEREADWRVLRAYSPYHNIRSGADYPAVLVTTADTDDRVVPAHSFKYVAALQAADIGKRPHLLRVESGAGHGSGKPTEKVINAGADVLAFFAYWTGLTIQ
jgi:prolyl oligopeptidase